ncbi:MAG TPA: hypothetical protein VKQ08_06260 [Cyclobacteriaceae bacterium]|nr:hypothetical protein [Cyclobacteriaceae bacterium]
MLLIANKETPIMLYKPALREIKAPPVKKFLAPPGHSPSEVAERLNKLANLRPFNILYRVKKHDPL